MEQSMGNSRTFTDVLNRDVTGVLICLAKSAPLPDILYGG